MIKEFRLLKDCMDAKFNNVEGSFQHLEDRLMDQQTEMKSTLVDSVSNNTQNIQWLLEQNQMLVKENSELRARVVRLEMLALENNVIITGIQENPWEKYETMKQCVQDTIASAMCGSSDVMAEALSAARSVEIVSCSRMGKYQLNRAGPISVKFQRKEDKINLMQGKKNLQGGVFMNNEYPIEVKHNRDLLLPILRLAKDQTNYRDNARLDADRLVINVMVYTVNDLACLPEDLSLYKAAQKKRMRK